MQITRTWRLTARVFLPFAAGYYLSYLFRTVNALIVSHLSSDAGLGSANLGLLTSVYFPVFAAAQIPIGVLLDRFGPRRVQSALLWFAALGAGLFAVSTGFLSFLIARAMIGLGVAAALTAGLKSIIVWFPRERVALLNGYMIMLGSLGAVTATVPVEHLLAWMGWRQLFGLQAAAGLILKQWSTNDDHRSITAYQVAFSLNLRCRSRRWFGRRYPGSKPLLHG